VSRPTTCSRRWRPCGRDGYRVEIVTGDRDAMQLVDDDVTVLYTLKGISEVGR
jgi:5'-3' exonuclease